MKTIPIADIDTHGRSRKDLGSVEDLARSIEQLGLLHPVVVTPDNRLIAGRRRLEAFRYLGRAEIPVNVVDNLDDLHLLLQAERDENTCRKPYTPEEAVHLKRRMAPLLNRLAKEAQRRAKGGDRRSGQAQTNQGRGIAPTLKQNERKRVNSQAAAAAEMDRRTLEKAEAVVDSGDRALIEEMNRTGRVNGVHRKLVVRQKAEAISKEPPPLPEGPFRVIVVDPPWHFEREDDPSHQGACPYPSMTVEEIKVLPVSALGCADSILWLWTTNQHLRSAFEVLDAWEYRYKTLLTWTKENHLGLGDGLRGQTEHCLMAVKGQPVLLLTNQTTALIAKATGHSRKPDEFYSMVEVLCPGSKVEMFQRQPRAGWVGHGDESGQRIA